MSGVVRATEAPIEIGRLPPGAPASLGGAFTVRDIATAMFYSWRAVLAAFALPAVLGLVVALLSHSTYTANAQLLVLLGSDYVYRPEVGTAGSGAVLDRNQIIQGELQILASQSLRMETLRAVGLERVYPDADPAREGALSIAADRMARDMTTTSAPQSNVIDIIFRNRDPQVAAEVVNRLIDLYLDRRRQVYQRDPAGPMAEQRDQFQKRLQHAEDNLVRFGEEHRIANFDDQIGLLLRQQADLAADQRQTESRIEADQAQIETLRRQVAATPVQVDLYADTGRSQQSEGQTAALIRLEQQRRDLLAKYQSDFPLVQDVTRQIERLRADMGATAQRETSLARRGRNPLYQDLAAQLANLQTELRGLQARRASLATSAAAIQARLTELDSLGREYRDLRRTRDVLEETFRTFARNTEESRLANELERSRLANVRIVQPAIPPEQGSSPRKLLFGGGIALGLISAAAILAVLTALRQVFVGVSDTERALGLPVLVAVPLVPRLIGPDAARRPGFASRSGDAGRRRS